MSKRYIARVLAVIVCMSTTWSAMAYDDVNKERQLKVAYLLNFVRFIYWPEEAFEETGEDFNICVYGKNPFGENINKLSSKKVKSKKIKLTYASKVEDISECHVVYFGQTEKDKYKSVVNKLTQQIVLTVSDIDGFSVSGGMIEFIRVKNKIKFEINVEQSARSGIKYRSQLLEVAEQLR